MTYSRVLVLAALGLGSTCAGSAHALGLSDISQQSALGEPLRLVIPVLGDATHASTANELSGCVRLTAPVADDLAQLNSARVALEQAGGATSIVITTPYPVNEPAMRIAVQAGCRTTISREYAVLLDPVTIEPPTAQIAANPPQRQPDERAAARADVTPAQNATTLPEASPAQQRATPQKRAAAAPRAQPTIGTRTVTKATTASQVAAAQHSDKALNRPRLHISRTIGARGPAAKGTAPTATSQREAMAAIEEQTVVLKRQLAELELAMQQVREQLDAAKAARATAEKAARNEAAATAAHSNEAAKAGRDPKQQAVQQAAVREATQRIAPPTPSSKLRAWTIDNAVFMLVALLAVLAVALAASIRRRQPVLIPAPMTAAQSESFNPADLGEPSVPGHPMVADDEALLRLAHERARGHMIPPPFVDPIAVEPRPRQPQRGEPQRKPRESAHDAAFSFDHEVQKHAEERSVQSALEREQPGIIARLTDGWGTPRTAAQVESFLLTPRRSGKPLSREVVDELQFLRRIAMDGGGPDGEMQAWMPRGRAHSPTAVRPH